MFGRLQFWLQGHPTKRRPYAVERPWIAWRLGNLISDVRFALWRASGGTFD